MSIVSHLTPFTLSVGHKAEVEGAEGGVPFDFARCRELRSGRTEFASPAAEL